MDIPLHKIHDIRRLLYTDRPNYAKKQIFYNEPEAYWDDDLRLHKDSPIKNDQVMKRLINEVIDILEDNFPLSQYILLRNRNS